MKRPCLLLIIVLLMLNSCREKAVDPTKRVRPVLLQITVVDGEYQLSWEPIRIVCVTAPCPDVADVEAETYEVQIATDESGTFSTFQTLNADRKSTSIPNAEHGGQIVARIVSKAKGAPPVNSVAVMATNGFLSQSAYYPGFGGSANLMGGDVTADGKRATYTQLKEQGPGQYVTSLYIAELENEQLVTTKLLSEAGGSGKFSSDGKQLVYGSAKENAFIIYDIASGQSRTLPVTDATRIAGIDWSPDGKWLAFITFSEEDSRLWKIAISGGPAIPLTPAMPISDQNYIRQADVDWSPDGQFIAASTARTDNDKKQWRAVISFYSPEATGELNYFETQPEWIDTNPAFSPNGKLLAFLSTRTNPSASSYTLWVRDLATGKPRRVELLPGLVPSDDYVPRWQGNERLIFMGTLQGKKGYFSVFL